jgi:hypothetical protein
MGKRAISITTPEISTIFFAIGFLLMVFGIYQLMSIHTWALLNGQKIMADTVMLVVMLLFIMCFFFLIAVAFPTYQIIKNNLFLFMDRISNPDYIGWFGFDRNKKFRPHIVKVGSFGNTKGVINGENADVINDGTYTVTTANGNQALIVNDMLSSNINLDNATGWDLIHKHFGMIGFKAYEKAANDNMLMFEYLEGNKKLMDKSKSKG